MEHGGPDIHASRLAYASVTDYHTLLDMRVTVVSKAISLQRKVNETVFTKWAETENSPVEFKDDLNLDSEEPGIYISSM